MFLQNDGIEIGSCGISRRSRLRPQSRYARIGAVADVYSDEDDIGYTKKRKFSKSRSKSPKRKLTEYNKFVQKHFHHPSFKNLSPREKIKKIASLWRRR